jgi:hypothetical protein
MSAHEQIVTLVNIQIEKASSTIELSPTNLALAVLHQFSNKRTNPLLKYSSLEHIKQVARKALAGHFEADGEDNEAYQGELFSGHLQERYPTPRKRGESPVYKLREHLSVNEAEWNIEQLRKSARARVLHANALQAWNESRSFGKST